MDWIVICLSAGIAYLIGSFNSAVVISRAMEHSDVRDYGSGNAGMTNMLRTYGIKAAVITLVLDLAKGFLACVIAGLLAKYCTGRFDWIDGVCTGGIFVVLGHNWPIFFGFRGGKGVLTTLAAMCMISPLATACALVVFLIIVAVTRYVSLGSITAAVLMTVLTAVFRAVNGQSVISYPFIASLILAVLLIARHHANIGRLLKGTESKISFSKKHKAAETVADNAEAAPAAETPETSSETENK